MRYLMMKSSLLALVIVIGAGAISQKASANQEQVSAPTPVNKGAAALVTEPATIMGRWNYTINPTNNVKQTSESILLIQERGCRTINPLELINNLDATLKECEKPNNNPTRRVIEPIEYLKVPRLDSGITVPVTKF